MCHASQTYCQQKRGKTLGAFWIVRFKLGWSTWNEWNQRNVTILTTQSSSSIPKSIRKYGRTLEHTSFKWLDCQQAVVLRMGNWKAGYWSCALCFWTSTKPYHGTKANKSCDGSFFFKPCEWSLYCDMGLVVNMEIICTLWLVRRKWWPRNANV